VSSLYPLLALREIFLVKHAEFRRNATDSAIYHFNRLPVTYLSDLLFFMFNFLFFLLFVFFSLRILLTALLAVSSFASLLFVLISLCHLHLMLLRTCCLGVFLAL
jgi:hypothetical protein